MGLRAEMTANQIYCNEGTRKAPGAKTPTSIASQPKISSFYAKIELGKKGTKYKEKRVKNTYLCREINKRYIDLEISF